MQLKNIITLNFCLFLFCTFAQAQKTTDAYAKFEWDVIQLGYAHSTELEKVKSGLVLGTEIRYNVFDDVSIGLETEFLFFFSNLDGDDNYDVDLIANGTLLVDFYNNTTSANRFFYGFGIGQNTKDKLIIRDGDEINNFGEKTSMALSGRVGHEFDKFRIKAQYTLNTRKEVSNHFTIKMAFTIGGKYKGQ